MSKWLYGETVRVGYIIARGNQPIPFHWGDRPSEVRDMYVEFVSECAGYPITWHDLVKAGYRIAQARLVVTNESES